VRQSTFSGDALSSIGSVSNADSFLMGRNIFNMYDYEGMLDDVRVYNRSLPGETVQLLYDNSAPTVSIHAGANAWWQLLP
jgi:hypothetical protein